MSHIIVARWAIVSSAVVTETVDSKRLGPYVHQVFHVEVWILKVFLHEALLWVGLVAIIALVAANILAPT